MSDLKGEAVVQPVRVQNWATEVEIEDLKVEIAKIKAKLNQVPNCGDRI